LEREEWGKGGRGDEERVEGKKRERDLVREGGGRRR
jgi:hypothetical protein